MRHPITVTDNLLHYDRPLVVTAMDAAGRQFVGLSYGPDAAEGLQAFAFVQVDRVTLTEFARGEVDLLTALTERHAGLILTGRAYGAPGEAAECDEQTEMPADALPQPGMFLPAQSAAVAKAA